MSDASPSPQANKPESKPEASPAVKAEAEKPPVEPGYFAQRLQAAGLKAQSLAPDAMGQEALGVEAADLLAVGKFLRDDLACDLDFLVCASAVDYKTYRETVYHLQSLSNGRRVALKVKAAVLKAQPEGRGTDVSPSLYPVWPAADWHEREAYDLMGVVYEGHPDLRRILMPTYWLGFPLRKDYVQNDPRLVWNNR